MEIWKEVSENRNYLVSNYGRVRGKRGMLMLQEKENGYLRVQLWENNKGKHRLIHRLVAKAFLPMDLFRNTVNHKDFNKHNNHVDNLEWMTRTENSLDYAKTKGGYHSDKVVKQVKELREQGLLYNEIEAITGVNIVTARFWVKGKFRRA